MFCVASRNDGNIASQRTSAWCAGLGATAAMPSQRLEYQRHEFLRKLRDLSGQQALQWSVPPVELSVLGLVRHMRQMEAGCLGWGLSGEGERDFYGDDDFAGGTEISAGGWPRCDERMPPSRRVHRSTLAGGGMAGRSGGHC